MRRSWASACSGCCWRPWSSWLATGAPLGPRRWPELDSRRGTMTKTDDTDETLVLGGTGKIGRRVVERLLARGVPTRVGSRSGRPPFDWENTSTWAPALEGVRSAYVSYSPDLAFPGATETVGAFAELAVQSGVSRLVLLAGRGEPEAEEGEEAVRESGADLTVLRSTFFAQNFSEDFWRDAILGG